jgi:hypothetical protein
VARQRWMGVGGGLLCVDWSTSDYDTRSGGSTHVDHVTTAWFDL